MLKVVFLFYTCILAAHATVPWYFPCVSKICPPNQTCQRILIDGVWVEKCEYGYELMLNCFQYFCPPNEICIDDPNDGPTCVEVDIPNICDITTCSQGYQCSTAPNDPRCVRISGCNGVLCGPGRTCVVHPVMGPACLIAE
mmetsp:Transcript_13121/g.16215  ORF Transcript_13121/g.16215 Transcript_13121/m.16215 type:complete len:141 (+) Transcript_13121:86-508(+)